MVSTGYSEVEHVGFTGTRLGLESKQRFALRTMLGLIHSQGGIWFHHGDCIGADEEAHIIARALGFKIHIHPPTDPKYQSLFTKQFEAMTEPRPYMVRNQDIIDYCNILVACPQQFPYNPQPQRSGTWSTVYKAFKKGIPQTIVYVDGTIEYR